MSKYNIAVIRGDGIGPEVIEEGLKILDCISKKSGIDFFLPAPISFLKFHLFIFFLPGLLRHEPWPVSAWRLFLLR